MSSWGPQPPSSQLSQYLNSHHGHFQSRMLGLGFFNSSFHKMWAFKRNIPTVNFFKSLSPGRVGAVARPASIRPIFPDPLSTPIDPASTQFPTKHHRQETWIQVPLTPWLWFTPAPSTSVFTCTMLCGVVTRPLLPPQLTASTQPQDYPVFYCPDPWQGHRAGQGNRGENNGYSLGFFCLFVFYVVPNTV